MEESSWILTITFVCFMTGLFSPEAIIRWGVPAKKHRYQVFLGTASLVMLGAILFRINPEEWVNRPELPNAFVFTQAGETVAVYRMAPSSFSNHLQLEVQSKTIVDANHLSGDELVALEILVTNIMNKPFYFEASHLQLKTEEGDIQSPTETSFLEETFEIEAGGSVLGTFMYRQPEHAINFQLKYLPFMLE